ncbi:MAG: VCBS repeat-containing protein [Candidatus Brocadiae bacterium]|nr:VCBS repeat-containing protein [Candidatus Brocadiia bacterium]
MEFEHIVLDAQTPGTLNDVCLIADLDGDGHNDVIVGGKLGERNVVWYEYPDWKRHTIGTARFEAGGVTVDITGNGRLDLVAGNDWGGNELYWFENPGSPGQEWPRRLIENGLYKYHNQAVGDVDGDGEDEIVVLSQQSRVVVYYDIPSDPRVSPWPKECRHTICEDVEVEGVAVADLDNDGEMEIVAGPYWFKREGGVWRRRPIAPGFRLTCVAVGDLDGDGGLEVVLSEGESHPARLAWFSGFPDWQMHVLREDLFHPHSLGVADFNGDGLLDIFVGEMGLGKNESPRLLVYVNRGDGAFEEVLIDDRHATHDAKAGVLGGGRLPSIVGKPYQPGRQVDLWLNKS